VPLLSEVLDLLRPYATPSELPPGIPSSGPALEGGSSGPALQVVSSGPALQVVSSELLLEIKRPATLDEVKAILAQVAERGLLERTIVQSFDPDVLRLAREVAPDVRRGLLRLRFDSETVPLAIELDVVCCNPSRLDVLGDPATVAALIDAGIAIMPWTANDMAEWPALVEAGVAGLITDRVGELTGWTSQP